MMSSFDPSVKASVKPAVPRPELTLSLANIKLVDIPTPPSVVSDKETEKDELLVTPIVSSDVERSGFVP